MALRIASSAPLATRLPIGSARLGTRVHDMRQSGGHIQAATSHSVAPSRCCPCGVRTVAREAMRSRPPSPQQR
eukprot:4839055-Prymnesium_polylepis.1